MFDLLRGRAREAQAFLWAFDLLALDGEDLRDLPLERRKGELKILLKRETRGDTVHAPPHADWICIARAGRNGCDGRSPNVCGTYDAGEMYERLDIVALDGTAFIARRDDPGVCPGDGWQLLVSRGEKRQPGPRGERGDKGERGADGATLISWQLDRDVRNLHGVLVLR